MQKYLLQEDLDISASPAIVAKKPKQSDQGSEVVSNCLSGHQFISYHRYLINELLILCFKDWEALIGSDHHKFIKSSIECCLGLDCSSTSVPASKHSFPSSLNTSSLLFVHIPAVFAALHLTFEVINSIWFCFVHVIGYCSQVFQQNSQPLFLNYRNIKEL